MYRYLLAVSASLFASAAMADYTALTTAADFTDVTTAVGTVAAAIVGVYVFWKGAKIVISAIKGA